MPEPDVTMNKVFIVARTEIFASHQWPDAPSDRSYLANRHVHTFHITVKAPVNHLDREIEFHDLLTELKKYIHDILNYRIDGPKSFGDMSCEMIASKLLGLMPYITIAIVSEDGKFDAEVHREETPK